MLKDLLGMVSLLGFVVVSILCLVSAKFGSEWASRMMDTILPQIVQCWIINITVIVQYHYGTSASSQRKSDTILKMLPKADCVEEPK
jgi:hypothetical protein